MSTPQNHDETIGAEELVPSATGAGKRQYEVGYGRPPKQYRFKKGQSGNPRGRPRKKLNKKNVWDKIMTEPMHVREEGKKPRKITKYEGLCLAQLAKGIKGHTGSAKFVIDEASRSGFGAEQDSDPVVQLPRKGSPLQSDALFANLDLNLLSKEDKIELARLADIIDLGGDFTALNERDFILAKQIADKVRGKDITPSDNPD
jgi:hypothetical protein